MTYLTYMRTPESLATFQLYNGAEIAPLRHMLPLKALFCLQRLEQRESSIFCNFLIFAKVFSSNERSSQTVNEI